MSSRVGPLLAAASGATSGGLVWMQSQQQQEKEQDHNNNHRRDGAQKRVTQTPREVNVATGRSESVSTPLLATSSSLHQQGALRWMPPNGIHSLDAIVLTHEHFDAIGGLDDVRGFQQQARPGSRSVIPMPIYLSPICYKSIEQQFHYLVPKKVQAQAPPQTSNNDAVLVTRHVASLDYHTIEPFQPFVAAGLRMIPLPVMHGEDLVCLGFAFTIQGDKKDDSTMNVIYLSDISRMLPETLQYIKESLPPTDVLIVDCLILERTHPVHFSLPQAVELIRDIKPRNGAFLVGMNCDTFLPHEQSNAMLRRDYPDISVQLAHDGLVLPV
eukprot:scaffold39583_cov36-Attheya_sp.AAC.1